ncbi:MAG: hypothetical protein SGJ11_02500 [Phycisphaerae bacterium]|nr:hypothetical protein [Phycisphaerae bacterium]
MRAAALVDIDRANDAIARLVWSPPVPGWPNDATTGSFDDIERAWLNFRGDQTMTAWMARMARMLPAG